MGGWSWQFGFSVAAGLVLFALLLVPVLVVQQRRYGRLSALRVLVVSAACVYAVALVAYTLLPLPDPATVCAAEGGRGPQLVPFAFVGDILRETAGLDLAATLASRATLQVVFNVVLFVPFGLLVRRAVGGVGRTTLLGLATSLLVEVTQGTALFGLYPCPYRLADVDDLIANTTGALLGALLARRVLAWLPAAEDLGRDRLRPRPVTARRRWLGMVVDGVVFTGVAATLRLLAAVVAQLTGWSLPAGTDDVARALPALVAGVVTFGPALTARAASLGQRAVWLQPVWPHPVGPGRRLLRTGVVGGAWTLTTAARDVSQGAGPLALVGGLATLVVVVAVVSVLTTRGHRGLSGALSGAAVVDSRAQEAGGSIR
ncbi:VanZ family protein [Microlunatus capsulatus]|uniref:Glycopeptide antibiotics resistance protein n=1 Tax=Microlunatus capsulatus TaxID=99117 RepID=A0ABS4Z494_9ACTN|nr:VanZ family protein [Microlunatus capsulatus]MBP2415869.1 glycopeptide antibiotics resistance protein [Microlunatus capsulatus]